MITEKLTQFAESVSVRLYVKRPAPMEQDWRLDNWIFPCFVAIPAQDSETVQETSGRMERRDFELMALRSVDVTFDTAEADAETEIARTEVLDFAQQIRGVFHVEHLGGRQIWDSANGELIVGWSIRLRITELVGESACGGEPEPAELKITENGTYNVLPFGRAVVDVQGGSPTVVEPLQVTPTTAPQTLTPSAGVDGFAPVEVDAVTAAIDSNIQATYIKKDVEILGVVGTMECESIKGFKFSSPINYTYFFDATNAERSKLLEVDDDSITVLTNQYGLGFENCTNLFKVRLNALTNRPGTSSYGTKWFQGCINLEEVYLPLFTGSMGSDVCTNCPSLKKYIAPQQTNLPLRAFYGGAGFVSKIEWIELGQVTTINNYWVYGSANYLRKLIVGQGTEINLTLGAWAATDVIAEGQSGIDELNYNIKTYLADRVADRTGDSALTITFGASLYNVLTADTIAAFTAKNWNVASA